MVGPGILEETIKNVENEKCTLQTWNMVRNTQKREKGEMHTIGPGIRRETIKTWKMKCTMWNLEYGEKTVKGGNENIHCIT